MSDYRHSYYDLPNGYDLDSLSRIAANGVTAKAGIGASGKNHRLQCNRRYVYFRLKICLFHNNSYL